MKFPRNIYCKVGNIFKNVAKIKKIWYNYESKLGKFFDLIKESKDAGHENSCN